ncbi:MAG: hypothetical protein HY329_23885 [Chloroflexi bacterium]|nr:hypothetical protein [Chloroflexota bacterium]
MYKVRLTLQSPLLIGGYQSSLVLDKTTARDDEGRPTVPASALKGALRIELERVLRSTDRANRCCGAPGAERMQSDHERMRVEGAGRCLACGLFGGPGEAGKLRFRDARLVVGNESDGAALFQTRHRVSLSRALRRAEPGRLFDFEGTAAGAALELETTIEERGALDDEERAALEDTLWWCQSEGLRIGGSRDIGLGAVKLSYEREAATARSSLALGSAGEPRFYRVTVTAQEEVRAAPPRRRGYFVATYPFIPGSTVRGALAGALREAGADAGALDDFFETRRPRISPLYPLPDGRVEDLLGPKGLRPATAVGCKARADDGPFDALVWQVLAQAALEQRVDLVPTLNRHIHECPVCGGKLDPTPMFAAPARHVRAKLALNRTLGRAEPGMVYVYETMPRKQRWQGWLRLDAGQHDALRGISPVLLGGSRSKGHGQASLEIVELPARAFGAPRPVEQRVESFNRKLAECATSVGWADFASDRVYATLDLLSDVILAPGQTLVDDVGRRGWKWEQGWLHQERAGGFNEWAGQPKALRTALAKGGVVVVSALAAEQERLVDDLAGLERTGLGLATDEGFGWVRACSPFHAHQIAGG